jgi:exodeoxyribonuclease V alpha subunit
LESIGCGNVAYDMIHSAEIPTVELTKIHRQAAKSAIITQSIAIRNGTQIVNKDWTGVETRGDLQDLELHCYSDSSNTFYNIMEIFSKLMAQKDFDIMDCQIIVPIKTRGDACTYKINNTIQELYNPAGGRKKEVTRFSNGKAFILREGDKVINVTNNYRLNPPIYNGNIGIIKSMKYDEDLDTNIMTIDFIGIGNVDVPEEYWDGIELGYAITVHKYQGSQSKSIIFGLDFSAYSLLTRELVYTGITRAQKKCYLVCQTGALRYATSQQSISTKQTHLQDCLYDVAHPKLIF